MQANRRANYRSERQGMCKQEKAASNIMTPQLTNRKIHGLNAGQRVQKSTWKSNQWLQRGYKQAVNEVRKSFGEMYEKF